MSSTGDARYTAIDNDIKFFNIHIFDEVNNIVLRSIYKYNTTHNNNILI